MEIRAIVGAIAIIKAGAIIVNLFEGTEQLDGDIAKLDGILDGAISELISQGEIRGQLNEVTTIHSLGKLAASRVVIVGLGKKQELSLDKVRGAVAETCRRLQQKDIDNIATIAQGAGIAGISPESSAQAVTEGALLGVYSFRKHITKKAEYGEIEQLSIVTGDQSELPALTRGRDKGKTSLTP